MKEEAAEKPESSKKDEPAIKEKESPGNLSLGARLRRALQVEEGAAAKLNLPNRISILRVLLVPLFAISILYYKRDSATIRYAALFIFCLGMFTDVLDGMIARLCKQKTRLGSYLDPLADKFLLDMGIVLLAITSEIPSGTRIPGWLAVLAVSRDIVIVGGVLLIIILVGDFWPRPTPFSKATTVAQAGLVISTLLLLPEVWLRPLWIVTGALIVISGCHYVWWGSRILNETASQSSGGNSRPNQRR